MDLKGFSIGLWLLLSIFLVGFSLRLREQNLDLKEQNATKQAMIDNLKVNYAEISRAYTLSLKASQNLRDELDACKAKKGKGCTFIRMFDKENQ